MANEEQLKTLCKGFRFWNRWRKENPEVRPDLSDAGLNGAKLSGANLNDADLTGAKLAGAELSAAQLNSARLNGADLTDADLGTHLEDLSSLFEVFGVPGFSKSLGHTSLKGADLRGANLTAASLTSADLRGADLRGANLTLAIIDEHSMEPGEFLESFGMAIPPNLIDAKLNGALLYKTVFRGALLRNASFDDALVAATQFFRVDLSNANGLAQTQHFAPINVDFQTLEITAASLDGKESEHVETFLRNGGFPLEYLKAFRQRISGAKFYSCFISHSSVDRKFCRKLSNRMKAEGLLVWYSPEDIQGGRVLYEQIRTAIQSHDKLLLVLSEDSMKSKWVELEIRETLKSEKDTGRRKLFPISVTDFESIQGWSLIDADTGQDLAVRIREFYIPDFSCWKDDDAFEESFSRLAADLQGSEIGRTPSAEVEDQTDSDDLVVRAWQ